MTRIIKAAKQIKYVLVAINHCIERKYDQLSQYPAKIFRIREAGDVELFFFKIEVKNPFQQKTGR